MRKKKFTPGPWEIGAPRGRDFHGDFEKHIDLPNADINIHGEGEELEANANLISAAPELLEALEDVESKIVDFEAGRINWRPEDFLLRVRAAIAKAYGE